MSPAEFRTAHDTLGVPTEYLAARVGVTVGTIWKYESPERRLPVPEHAAEVVRDLLNDRAAAIERALETYAPHGEEVGVMPRYVDPDHWREDWPEFRGWPDSAQAAFLAGVLEFRPDLPVDYSPSVSRVA